MVSWTCQHAVLNWPMFRSRGVSRLRDATVRSRVPGDGNISPWCVPGRQSVASFALHVSQKWPRTGKAPLPGNISPPCIQNELTLARFARHVSEMPCKSLFGNTPREDLATKGSFRCTDPSNHARRADLAIRRRRTTLAPATTPPSAWQRTTHGIRGASGSHTANAPTPHRPTTLRRQADVKSCAARAPQRQSAVRGPTAPQHPTAPPGRNIHNGGDANQARCGP